MNSSVQSILALQAENRSLQEEQAQMKFDQAMQAEQIKDRSNGSVSTITAHIKDLEQRCMAQERSNGTSTTDSNSASNHGQSDQTCKLLAMARNHNPADC